MFFQLEAFKNGTFENIQRYFFENLETAMAAVDFNSARPLFHFLWEKKTRLFMTTNAVKAYYIHPLLKTRSPWSKPQKKSKTKFANQTFSHTCSVHVRLNETKKSLRKPSPPLPLSK